MTRRNSAARGALALALLAAAAAGCVTAPGPGGADTPVSDPCAERLHDLSGRLLAFYAAAERLPASLAGLPGDGAEPLVCPISKRPYLYRPAGLVVPGRSGRLVVCGASAVHRGGRWSIVLTQDRADGPVSARVIWLSEETVRGIRGLAPAND
jgi:hypothetical protein